VVNSVQYVIHKKTGKPDSLRVIYNTGKFGITPYSEYICLYHDGFAQQRARDWWTDRCEHEVPIDIENALKMTKAFKQPLAITIKRDGKYWRIMNYKFDNKKDPPLFFPTEPLFNDKEFDENEDIPF
jgi:DNA repair protein RadD